MEVLEEKPLEEARREMEKEYRNALGMSKAQLL